MQENMMGKRHTGNTGADKPKGHEGWLSSEKQVYTEDRVGKQTMGRSGEWNTAHEDGSKENKTQITEPKTWELHTGV